MTVLTAEELEQLLEVNCNQIEDETEQEEPCRN